MENLQHGEKMLETENKELKLVKEDLTNMIATLRGDLNKQTIAFKMKESELFNLQGEMSSLRKKLQQEKEDLHEKVEDLQIALESAKKDLKDKEDELNMALRRSSLMSQQNPAINVLELGEMMEDGESQGEMPNQSVFEAGNATTSDTNKEQIIAMETARKEIEALKKSLLSTEKLLKGEKKKRETLKGKAQELKDQNKKYKEMIKTLKNDKKQLKEDLKNRMEQLENQPGQADQAPANQEQMELVVSEDLTAPLLEQIRELENEKKNLEDERQLLEDEKRETKDENNRLKKEKKTLEKKIQKKKDVIQQLNDKYKQAKGIIDTLKKKNAEERKKGEGIQQRADEEIDNLRARIMQSTMQYATVINQANDQLAQAQDENLILERKVQILTEQRNELCKPKKQNTLPLPKI